MTTLPDCPKGWYLTLDDENNVVTCDLFTWARMMENHERRTVARDRVEAIDVITAFFGYDHAWWLGFARPAQLRPFGTCVRGGFYNGERRFYASWADAARGHSEIVALVRALDAGEHLTLADAARALADVKVTVADAIQLGLLPALREDDEHVVVHVRDVQALRRQLG